MIISSSEIEKRANQQSEDSPTEEKREQEILQGNAANQKKEDQVSANEGEEELMNEETQPTKMEENEASDINLNTEGTEKELEQVADAKDEDREIVNLPGL